MKKVLRVILILLLASLASCTFMKITLDQWGIEDIAESILQDFNTDEPQELKNYLQDFTLRREKDLDTSAEIQVGSLQTWQLEGDLIQERITFPSPIKKSDGSFDTAVFYLYRKGSLKSGRVIVWIPGFGVSDLAFRFIKTFFYNELEAGYSVLFYNIPYHLERIEEGRKMGEGLFTADNRRNLETVRQMLYEVRVAVKYLEDQGVSSLSGWGGSIGAALLWLSSGSITYRHMTLMIPIVDWNSIIFHPRMAEVITKMKDAGLSEELIRKAYTRINPMHYPTKTDPERIQILCAEHDQLTPESKIHDFAQKWNIGNVHCYDQSHSSILISGQIYEDNMRFLKQLKN